MAGWAAKGRKAVYRALKNLKTYGDRPGSFTGRTTAIPVPDHAATGANRLDIRVDRGDIHEVCRIDVPASSCPIWVKNKKGSHALYQRRNNSTREVPAAEVESFIAERFR